MGGEQSSQKGSTRLLIKDLLKFLEEEVKKWDDNVKNIRAEENKGDRSWVPFYLGQQMEETETKWTNIKELMQPVEANGGSKETRDAKTKLARCCEETLKRRDNEISQLKSNNFILLQKSQETETQIQKLQIKLSEYDKIQLSRKTEDVSEHPTVPPENESAKEPAESNLKEGIETPKENTPSPKDIVKCLQNKVRGMEEDFKRHKLVMKERCDILTAQKETMEIHVSNVEKEKDNLLMRLSKMAGERLVENNPAIADLSDPNRPTKLGEMYSEIYDNEWTDAFEALKDAGYEEETAIETLRMTLQNVVQFCERKGDLLIRKAADAVNLLFEDYRRSVIEMKIPCHLTMPRIQSKQIGPLLRETTSLEEIKLQRRWKPKSSQKQGEPDDKETQQSSEMERIEQQKFDPESKLKLLRKEVATSMVPIVQKAYMEASWSNECIEKLKPFIMKCLYLGWMMVVQSPPLVLHKFTSKQDAKFDKNMYKEFTSSGPLVSFMVWPALLLHENGSVVGKGVAQGKKT